MKELSFLMFIIVFTALFKALIDRIFKLNANKRAFFYIPSSSRFNIVWGLIFYAGYGFIISKTDFLRLSFGILIILMFFYLVYLYVMKGFLFGHYKAIKKIMNKIIDFKLDEQKKTDNKLQEKIYSKEKSLQILGVPSWSINQPDLLQKRLQALQNLQTSNTVSNSYLNEIIKKLSSSLKIK